jgi:hypothetical protein
MQRRMYGSRDDDISQITDCGELLVYLRYTVLTVSKLSLATELTNQVRALTISANVALDATNERPGVLWGCWIWASRHLLTK